MAVVLSICYSFATTIYCQMTQEWWTVDGAAVAVHYWGGTSAATTWPGVRMSAVTGKTGTWSYDVPSDVTGLMFVRVNSSGAIENWGAKTANLTLPTDGKNLYIITSASAVWGDPGCTGKWSTYDVNAAEETIVSSVPSQAPDVMLQAFYWDSYPGGSGSAYGNTGWETLLNDSAELGEYFDLVWFPPTNNGDGTGYIPKQYSNLNSAFGSEANLRLLIGSLHRRNSRAVADIVINHCGNRYNSCDFYPLDFGTYGTFQPDNTWITTNDEGGCSGGSHADAGYDGEENYGSARDWDHQNPNVQAMCRAYLKWMKAQGFDGWRYDYGKGFTHDHINDYNTAAGAYFSVVEYWDGNRDVLQDRLSDAGWNTMVFDFSTKYNALNNGICSFDYSKCHGAGLPGAGKSKYAVTFVDNHDTFTRNDSEFGGQNNSMTAGLKDRLLQANAYILSMPGIPCVFYPHWVTYKTELKKMIEARHMTGVHSESEVKDEYYDQNGYQATIVGKNGYIVLQLGNKAGNAIDDFTKYAYGNGYAIWVHTNAPVVPADPTAKFYVAGDSALVVDAGLAADKAWNADAIKSESDTLTLTLKAGVTYSLKVTPDGTWNNAKGYSDLTAPVTAGLNNDNGNISFKLNTAGEVKVIYKTGLFKLEGDFYVKPAPEVVYYLKNNWAAGEWAWKEMTKVGETYKLDSVVFGGNGVNYNTAESDENAVWVALADFAGDKIQAKDTVSLVLNPADSTITATLIGRPAAPAVIEDGYYLVGTMNNWTPKAAYKFSFGEGWDLTTALEVGDEFKVVSVSNGQITTWYPGEGGNNYVVGENFAGSAKKVSFRPDGLGDGPWFEGYIFVEPNVWRYDIYLNTGGANLWGADDAEFEAYPNYYDDFPFMTHVSGDVYKISINIFSTTIVFQRVDPININHVVWNQTAELTIPEGMNLYTITGWGENDGYWSSYGDVPSDVDLINDGVQTVKVLRDGQLLIIKGEKTYNAQGQLVK